MKQKELPKAPVDRILEQFFTNLRSATGFDDSLVPSLEKLANNGKLTSISDIKPILIPPDPSES